MTNHPNKIHQEGPLCVAKSNFLTPFASGGVLLVYQFMGCLINGAARRSHVLAANSYEANRIALEGNDVDFVLWVAGRADVRDGIFVTFLQETMQKG